MATWVIAMLSNGPYWFTTAKVVSPAVMGLSVLSASLYHFGAANSMYARKNEVLSVEPFVRRALIGLGVLGLALAVYLAVNYLNAACQIVVALDALIIVAYAGLLSRHWLTKNILMAFVCASPVLLGWLAGHRLHPAVPYGIGVTFLTYLTREVVKDIQDRVVNHGHRLTLPLWLGVMPARRIASGLMFATTVVSVVFGTKLISYNWYTMIPYVLSLGLFLMTSYSLAFSQPGKEKKESAYILLGSFLMLVTFGCILF
jgi:hypothetical protein